MAKVATAFLIVVGLWVSAEVFQQGPQKAFGGIFSSFSSSSEPLPEDEPRLSTAQRAGGSVSRSRDEATARRERLLGE